MFKAKSKPKLLRIPKILSILYILVLTILSLDAFSGNISFFQQVIQFLIHMVPVFVLLGILMTAWNRPKLGGTLFLVTALVLTICLKTYLHISSFFATSFPLCLIGLLFILLGLIDERIY